jgi:hypothetical protein
MSSPDRAVNRASSRRRDYRYQPQHYKSSQSPFRRARHTLDRDSALDFEPSRIPSPSSKNGVRPRTSFGLTNTLRGAFEATSQAITMDVGESENALPAGIIGRTPSPRSRRQRNLSLPSPLAEVNSPPPGELLETYQRINDADNLADLVSQDDLDIPPNHTSRRSSGERLRNPSPTSSFHQLHREEAGGNNYGAGLSYLDDVTDDSVRKKLANHIRDEERLRRVTSSQSPVFSKAKVGSKSETLQRRDEVEPDVSVQDVDEGPRPGLNVPRSWGNRSRNHRDWLTSITRQNGDTPRERAPRRSVEGEVDADIDFTGRSLQMSDSPPVRPTLRGRDLGPELPRRKDARMASPRQDRSRTRSQEQRPSTDGDAIPNTPVVVYKATPRDRLQKSRSDSRELLRKLARTESPIQSDTPEEQKPGKELLPDKTPVVIGAWVDTPMTERPLRPAEAFAAEIDSPSKPGPNPSPTSTEISSTLGSSTAHQMKSSQPTKNMPQKGPVATFNSEVKADKPEVKPSLLRPQLPKSALEAVIEDAKLNGNPLVLGDDTINSLQDLMLNDNMSSKLPKRENEEVTLAELKELESDLEQLPSTSKDTTSLDRLSSKLQTIIHSIHDARTGLNGLEEQISPDSVVLSKYATNTLCEKCGDHHHQHGDGRIYLAIPFPRLWQREAISGRLRPTYLGWALLVFISWYISECTMCDYYCHPTVAEVCDGYCLRPDAPKFPFTVPTMLWRWSHLSVILSPIVTIVVAFVRLLAQLLGLWDGYVDDSYPSSGMFWSSSALDDIAIGSSNGRGGYYGFWSGASAENTASKILTSASAESTKSASQPTILQKIIPEHNVRWTATEGEDNDGTIDDDEIL